MPYVIGQCSHWFDAGATEIAERAWRERAEARRNQKSELTQKRFPLCIHECGHIIAAFRFKARPYRAVVDFDLHEEVAGTLGAEFAAPDFELQGLALWHDSMSPGQRLITALAGAAAERHFLGAGEPSASDMHSARRAAEQLGGDPDVHIRSGETQAAELIDANASAVKSLAAALIFNDDALDEDEIGEIVSKIDAERTLEERRCRERRKTRAFPHDVADDVRRDGYPRPALIYTREAPEGTYAVHCADGTTICARFDGWTL